MIAALYARISTRDKRLLADALYRAIQFEDSLAEAWGIGTPGFVTSTSRAAEFRAMLNAFGYREPSVDGPTVSVFELAKRKSTS